MFEQAAWPEPFDQLPVSAQLSWPVIDQPELSVVASAEHQALAQEAAQRSITLVRNDAGLLPLKLDTSARIAAIMPEPKDLTPADTSKMVAPALATALRNHHDSVDEFIVSHPPTDQEIAEMRCKAADYDLIVLGTISASMDEQQAERARQLLASGTDMVVVALRTPYDLMAFPNAETYVCSYGIRPSNVAATAAALFGTIPFAGRLPVTLSDQYPIGHGSQA